MDTNPFQNATSVAQQQLSNAQSVVTGFESKMNSAAASAQGALNDLSKNLAAAGQNASDAAKNALNQFGAFSSISKFVDKLTAPKKIPDIRPENARGKLESTTPILTYPLDLGRYFIRFTFKKYHRPAPLQARQELEQVSIFLPIPSDLNDRFSVQYADKQLGAFGILQESGLINAVGSGKTSVAEMQGVGERAGRMAAKPENLAAIIQQGTGLGDTGVGQAIVRAAGATANPYQALTFQGVDLRSHSFRFRCSPNSEAEAEELKKIIFEFKRRMLPEKKDLLFLFPDICTIQFSTKNMPYSFKNCFLKSMSVNYAPSGTPAFFKGGKYPAEVEIGLEFGEIEPVTRDDLGENGDITGGVGEAYGKPSGMAVPSTAAAAAPKVKTPSKSTPERGKVSSEVATGQTNPLVNTQ